MNKIVAMSVVRLNCNKLYQTQTGLRVVPPSRQLSDNSDDGKKGKEKLEFLLQSMKLSGGSEAKTELDSKLAKPNFSNPIKRDKGGKPKSHLPPTKELDDEMVSVTKDVASLNSNTKQRHRNESELLMRLKQLNKDTADAKRENEISGEDMKSFLSDMKVDKPMNKRKQTMVEQDLSMEQAAFLQSRAKLRRQKGSRDQLKSSVDLKSGIPLGIFTGPMEGSEDDSGALKTWRACRVRQLDIISKPPPRNAIDEMILQTKQGKLWHFPINNEQGLDYSDDPFYQHVFLEHHLDPWCPKVGPVRHFMETLCIGLSKNPYMSSLKKVDTIKWFKEYFERPENQEILVHSGFWEDPEENIENISN